MQRRTTARSTLMRASHRFTQFMHARLLLLCLMMLSRACRDNTRGQTHQRFQVLRVEWRRPWGELRLRQHGPAARSEALLRTAHGNAEKHGHPAYGSKQHNGTRSQLLPVQVTSTRQAPVSGHGGVRLTTACDSWMTLQPPHMHDARDRAPAAAMNFSSQHTSKARTA